MTMLGNRVTPVVALKDEIRGVQDKIFATSEDGVMFLKGAKLDWSWGMKGGWHPGLRHARMRRPRW